MNQEETAKDVRESDRGREIVEQAEAMRRRISAGGVEPSSETTKKKSVQEVVARAEFRTRNESNVSQPDESDAEEQPCEDEGVANASTSVVPSASGPPALSQDQPPVDMPQPMEDNLHNLNGDGEPEDVDKTHDDIDETSEWINPKFLRQEEEEDSQDIIAERRQHQERDEEEGMREINSNEVRDLNLPPVCAPSPRLASINGDTGGPSPLVPAEVSHRFYFCVQVKMTGCRNQNLPVVHHRGPLKKEINMMTHQEDPSLGQGQDRRRHR